MIELTIKDYSDYLINNRFYIKSKITIQCCEINYDIQENIEIENYIDLEYLYTFENGFFEGFEFNHFGIKMIYWCDLDLFTKLRCKTKSEVRNSLLYEILK